MPFQNRVTPSSVKMRYAQCSALRYSVLACSDCIRVLTTLKTMSASVSTSREGYATSAYSRGMVESGPYQRGTSSRTDMMGLGVMGRTNGDDACGGTDPECDPCWQLNTRGVVTLDQLLERRVRGEANG